MKNRESQQFFQCEICEHFFQSESILEKHIKGHQVERVARYKISPSIRNSSSKRKRKHSKKHKKKHEKREKQRAETIHLDGVSKENLNNDINTTEMMDIDAEKSDEKENVQNNEISNLSKMQTLPARQNDIQTESVCQMPKSINGSSNDQPTVSAFHALNADLSIPTSPCEINLNIGAAELVSPEIEQAVASISGPNLSSEPSPKNICNEDHVNVSSSVLPLTSGTLEIENAVNSILGETSDLSQVISQENSMMFDIKQNSETTSPDTLFTVNEKTVTNCDLLDNITAVNGDIREHQDTTDIQEMSKTNVLDMTINIPSNSEQELKLRLNGSFNGEHTLTEEACKEKNIISEDKPNSLQNKEVSPVTPHIPCTISALNGNNLENDKNKLENIDQKEKLVTESLEKNKLLPHNLLVSSSKPTTDFDISNPQNSITKDMLEKDTFPSNSINPQSLNHVVNSSCLETPNMNMNNGGSLDH